MLDDGIVARFRARHPGMELSLSRHYRQPAEKVFAALTTPERIEAWMGVEWLGDPAPLGVGSRFSYRFANSDMVSEGRVLALEPGRRLDHTWFENMPPTLAVCWTVKTAGDGCLLTLIQTCPYPDDAPRNGAGWTQIMRGLDAWLGGTAAGESESWSILRERYAQSLGPASVRDGERLTVGGKPVVRFKRLVNLPVAETWVWLTDPAKLAVWLDPVDVQLEPGGAFRIHFANASFVMDGTLTAVEAPRRLEMIWREPWFTADDVILAFELEAWEGGTLLTLTHAFPEGYDPQEYLAGWHDYLDSLENSVSGRPVAWDAPERRAGYRRLEMIYKAVAGATA